MSYYFHHIIECDKLTYERMLRYWRQKGWVNNCDINRPRHVWAASKESEAYVKAGTYLLYIMGNHRPDAQDLMEWLEDDLGVYSIHFSFWSIGECDDGWFQSGAFVAKSALPAHTAVAEYDYNAINRRKAPEGFKTYDDCDIAIDPAVWKDITVDYTREEEINVQPSMEKLLQEKTITCVRSKGCWNILWKGKEMIIPSTEKRSSRKV